MTMEAKRKPGRPRLPEGKARTVRVTVRMTNEEYQRLLATMAPGTTMASILREGLFDGTIVDVTNNQ